MLDLDQHYRHESLWLLHQDQAGYRSTRTPYPAWDTGGAEEVFGDEESVYDENKHTSLAELKVRKRSVNLHYCATL